MDEGENAEFLCRVDANPFTESTVTWDLPDRGNYTGGDRFEATGSRVRVDYDGASMTSRLTIYAVTPGDAGRVICKANNSIKGEGGNTDQQTTTLVVNRKCSWLINWCSKKVALLPESIPGASNEV